MRRDALDTWLFPLRSAELKLFALGAELALLELEAVRLRETGESLGEDLVEKMLDVRGRYRLAERCVHRARAIAEDLHARAERRRQLKAIMRIAGHPVGLRAR